jgi:hypothetical protein
MKIIFTMKIYKLILAWDPVIDKICLLETEIRKSIDQETDYLVLNLC